jgi:hypothetical protein
MRFRQALLLVLLFSLSLSSSAQASAGHTLYVFATAEDSTSLWLVDAETGSAESVHDWDYRHYCGQFSPNKEFYLFGNYMERTSSDAPDAELSLYFLESNEPQTLYSERRFPYTCPVISPDSAYIAYIVDYAVYIYDIANEQEIEVLAPVDYSSRTVPIFPAINWLPDSSGIVFDADTVMGEDFAAALYYYDLQSNQLDTLIEFSNSYYNYRLEPLTGQIAYVDTLDFSHWDIGIYHRDGHITSVLSEELPSGSRPGILSWSPDGRFLVYYLNENINALSLYDAASQESQSKEIAFTSSYTPVWLDNEHFMVFFNSTIQMVNALSFEAAWMNEIYQYSYSPDGLLSAALQVQGGSTVLKITDLASGTELASHPFSGGNAGQAMYGELAYAWSDDSLYYAASWSINLGIANTSTGAYQDLKLYDDTFWIPYRMIWR